MNYLKTALILLLFLTSCSKDDGISVKIPILQNHIDSTLISDKVYSKPKKTNFSKKIKIICKSKTSTYICDTIKTRGKESKKIYKKFGRLKKSPYICKTNQKRGKGRKTF